MIFRQEQVLPVECAWGIFLIRFIMGRFPGIDAFNEISASWQVPHKYMFHDSGWTVFRFENVEDREKVLTNGPYATFGSPWLLK